jgi:hypothetical protein
MKKYDTFIIENSKYLSDTDTKLNLNDVKNKIENGEIKIDFRMPNNNDIGKEREKWLRKSIVSGLTDYGIKYLPTHLLDYEHPINGEYCSFVLYEKEDGTLAITLANIDSTHKYKEIEIPEKLIDGDYISTELDISSGKICLLGDNVRNLFPEDDWGIDNYKSRDNFRDNEKDALKHIDYFSKKGYFFVAESFYLTISKKNNEYNLFSIEKYDDDKEIENGDIIKEDLMIDSDHTLVIIDHDLLYDKLNKYEGKYDDNSRYFKYCFNVEPGKYKLDYNWERKIDENTDILTYCKISKVL